MNVNKVITKEYENKPNWTLGENEPKTNPIKPNFKKAKMNVTSILTVGYENKPPIRALKKQTQFLKRQKPMQASLPQRIMKITTFSGSDKTNPNKANFRANIMLLHITINTRRKSLGHYTDEIEVPNAYDRPDDSPVAGQETVYKKPAKNAYFDSNSLSSFDNVKAVNTLSKSENSYPHNILSEVKLSTKSNRMSSVDTPQKKQWAGLDSNQRKLTLTGLQPVPFSLSGTDPLFIEPFYMLPAGVARRIPETSSWA